MESNTLIAMFALAVLGGTAMLKTYAAHTDNTNRLVGYVSADVKEMIGQTASTATPVAMVSNAGTGTKTMSFGVETWAGGQTATDMDQSILNESRYPHTAVAFKTSDITNAMQQQKPMYRQAPRYTDVGIEKLQNIQGAGLNSTQLPFPFSKEQNQLISAKASDAQVLPPMLNGNAGSFSQTVIQSRRNVSLDLRGEPRVKLFDRCGFTPLNQSTIGDADVPGKVARTMVNDIVPKPVNFNNIKDFFTNPSPGAFQPQSSSA